MRNSLICIFLSALSLFACTEVDDLVVRDGVVVSFVTPGMNAGESEATRAVNTYVPLDEGVTVRILVYRRKGNNPDLSADEFIGENTYVADDYGQLSACVVDANGDKTTGTPTELRLIQGSYDFYAITPALPTVSNDHKTISVKHGVDYATSLTTKTIAPGAGTVPLTTLDRKCSKVEFNFDRKSSNVTEIQIDEVSLCDMSKAPLTGKLAENLPDASAKTDTVKLGSSVFTIDQTTKYKAKGSTIILPKTAGDLKVGMKLKFNGGSTQVTLKPATVKNLAFAQGTRYIFKVVLLGGSVKLTLTVADWAETYNITADNLGASNSLTIEVGEWNNVNFDASTGGSANTNIGDWTVNPEWDNILGEYSGLTNTTVNGSTGWGNENNSNPSTGGSSNVNGDDWGGQHNGGMNNGGTSTDDWGNNITPDGELGK